MKTIALLVVGIMLCGIAHAVIVEDEWGNTHLVTSQTNKKGITVEMSRMVEESKSAEWIAEKERRQAEVDDRNQEQETETLIQEKIRALAVASLKVDGKLDQDGKMVKGE